jgi:DNA-binding FadR family transcriptional regulator
MAVLGIADVGLYDSVDDDSEGDALVGAVRPGPGYRQVAGELRRRVLSGEYAPGTAIPRQGLLADEFGADVAVVNRAVNALAAEGLVRVEHGRPTVVLARRRFRVAVEVARPEDDGPRDAEALSAAIASAAAGEPAAEVEATRVLASSVQAILVVTAASPARAGAVAETLVWSARGQWSWDGLDLAWSMVTSAPAAEA